MAERRAPQPVPVVDLDPTLEPPYFACLEDWPGSDVLAAGDHKRRWYARAREQGLRVKLALDETGRPAGMIQVLPIEHAPALGHGLHFVLCIWVLPRTPLGPSRQGRGLGSALLAAAEREAREGGALGMAAWGLALPVWMRASWFRAHGYRKADRRGLATLLWKPFTPAAAPPAWLPETGRRPEPAAGKVVVCGCVNGWCTGQNLAVERARRAAAAFGDAVEVRLVDTGDRATMLEWGQSDALFVDGRPVSTGPPPSEARLTRLIRRRVGRLARLRPPG